ncbi:MAG: amidohydrolase [Alphaproteobacteria bacterium]|nr:amidohydrolase [Alphaproteobacteria bacterium]
MRLVALVVILMTAAGPALSQARLPIFDTHLHYSEPAWAEFPPSRAAQLLRAAGVTHALVSSSPDDGSLALQRADSGRYIPVLRPYRGGIGPSNWTQDNATPDYLSQRLKKRRYAGIGEFHLYDAAEVASDTVQKTLALAKRHRVMVHVHSGAAPIEAILQRDPAARVMWAHAGLSEPAEVVLSLLDRYPNLLTEVSFRAGDIAPGGTLAPVWRELLLKHRKRIMVGTDTYVTPRWGSYGRLIDEHRQWLARLPDDVAADIAYRNAERLFVPQKKTGKPVGEKTAETARQE